MRGGLKAGSEVAEGWIQSVNALAWIHLRHDIPILIYRSAFLRYAAHCMNGKQSAPCIGRNVPLKFLRCAGRCPETMTLPCEVGIAGVAFGSARLLRSHFER